MKWVRRVSSITCSKKYGGREAITNVFVRVTAVELVGLEAVLDAEVERVGDAGREWTGDEGIEMRMDMAMGGGKEEEGGGRA